MWILANLVLKDKIWRTPTEWVFCRAAEGGSGRKLLVDQRNAGADIVTVQKLMGHANANTTAGYDRRQERTKRDAVARLHMAWSWKGNE